jgi:hypothetical protein
MRAQVGDRLIQDGDPDRIGVVIGLRNADGSPPYVVKWLTGGHIALVFPGPYARIVHADPANGAAESAGIGE